MLPLSVCGLVFDVGVLAVMLGSAAGAPEGFMTSAFGVAFLTLGSALYRLNGNMLGRVSQGLVWQTLRLLPRWAQVGLGALYAVVVVAMFTTRIGAHSEVDFARTFTGFSVLAAAVGTALHYGMQVQGEEEPAPPGKVVRIMPVISAAVSLVFLIAWFVFGHNPA